MKKILLLVSAITLLAAPAMAQTTKVDKDAVLKKIARSDADIANPKKNTKLDAWLDRGKVFSEAATAPYASIYKGMEETLLTLFMGKPTSSSQVDAGDGLMLTKNSYPYVDVYMVDGKVAYWEATETFAPNALAESFKAYQKAYELDPKSAPKVQAGFIDIANAYKQDAENNFTRQRYAEAAADFRNAYDVQMAAPLNQTDTASVFNAGFLYAAANDFQKGKENLEKALELGYDSDGDTYFYLYHCYFGLGDNQQAKDILLEGLKSYPENNRIVEGLIAVYSSDEDGNPSEIVPIVLHAIENEPNNADLWGGLGRIYDQLDQPDKAIEAFQKSADLMPNQFSPHFNLGLLYLKYGDKLLNDFNSKSFTSQADYNKELDEVNDVYSRAVAPLEEAHKINPTEPATVELLKNVSFRLRDEPGMGDKYTKYNELFQQMQQQ